MSDNKLTYADKFLPTQPEFRSGFDGSDRAHIQALFDAVMRTSGLAPPDQEFDIEGTPMFTIQEMGSSPMVLRLLQLLIRLSGARRVLEIGAFVGISALYMAKALPVNGRLTAVEKFDHFAEIAQRNFDANGVADKITLINADAFEFLRERGETPPAFDFVFLDGNKERYADYFAAIDPHLAPGGLFVADDAFFHGDALNETPASEKGAGVRRFLDVMEKRDDYFKLLLPVANGVFVARKAAPDA